MIGPRVVSSGGGGLIGGGWGDASVAASGPGTGDGAAGTSVGAGVAIGSFRTEEGTSGRGVSSAIRASIWRRLRPEARVRTASWFSGVRCGRSILAEVRDIAPEARR